MVFKFLFLFYIFFALSRILPYPSLLKKNFQNIINFLIIIFKSYLVTVNPDACHNEAFLALLAGCVLNITTTETKGDYKSQILD